MYWQKYTVDTKSDMFVSYTEYNECYVSSCVDINTRAYARTSFIVVDSKDILCISKRYKLRLTRNLCLTINGYF